MPPLPSPVRAALGLVATIIDEARSLPDKAIELPMLAISRALQLSLRAQQHYTALAARGDELLAGRQTTDEPPPWATFDPPAEDAPGARASREDSPVEDEPFDDEPVESQPADSTPVEDASGESAAVEVPPGEDAPADSAPVDDLPVPTDGIAPKPPKPRKPRTRKTVRAPRTGTPSAFDVVGDSADDAE